MDRRSYLRGLSAASVIGLAGCQERAGSGGATPTDGIEETPGSQETVGTTGDSRTSTRENPDHRRTKYHVGPDGSNSNEGSLEEPLETIHEALQRAMPGDTVQITPGEYQEDHAPGEPLQTIRDGELDAPITITGPEEAILYPNHSGPALWIKNSHIRLRGLTIDGLLDSDRPDDASSYSRGNLIHCHPIHETTEYLRDIVCAPAAIGNSHRPLMVFERTKYLEIGPLRVNGLAGAEYVIGGKENHVGEIIYLGQPPIAYERHQSPWPDIDQTSHVHIHHIDNSAGHPHSELVDAKFGTSNVLIEYCTDGGGSQNNEPEPDTSLRLSCYDSTIRWNDLRNGQGRGIRIDAHNRKWLREQESRTGPLEKIGTNNEIYGNSVEGFPEEDLLFDSIRPEDQKVICGNSFSEMYYRSPDEYTELKGDPSRSCPMDVPKSDGIGHTGGDSPWKGGSN